MKKARAESKGVVMVADVDLALPDATRTHTTEVARWLAELGFDLDLVANGPDPQLPGVLFQPTGVKKFSLAERVRRVNGRAIRVLWSRRRTARICYVRFDWSSVPVLLTARLLRYRLVTEMNDVSFGPGYQARPPGPRGWLADRARRWSTLLMGRLAAAVVTVTAEIKDLLVRYFHFREERVVVLPNGVDVNTFKPRSRRQAIQRLELDPDCRYVVFVGRFDTWADFDTLLEAFAETSQERPWARLILAGDGPERQLIESLIREHQLEGRVLLPGFVSERDRISDYMAAATVCVAAHRRSHLARVGVSPVKAAEYFASGRAVVALELPGLSTMIKESGAGISADDATEMAAAIGSLLDDPKRADELGALGRRAAEKSYSWRTIVERTTELFEPEAL